jgi:peroxiredoxin
MRIQVTRSSRGFRRARRSTTLKHTGVKIGANAPKLTLQDQEGEERSLDEFVNRRKVALVFYRSADWWPYCRAQLVQLQPELKLIVDAGAQIVGISYDSPAVLKTFSDRAKITFPLLSDPASKTIDAYHIRNAAVRD